jgi:hypothetical protein
MGYTEVFCMIAYRQKYYKSFAPKATGKATKSPSVQGPRRSQGRVKFITTSFRLYLPEKSHSLSNRRR